MARRLIQLALGFALLHAVAAACPPKFDQFICAVSYSYPDPCSLDDPNCPWYSYSNGADIVIINPNSGPGNASDPAFVNLISSIRQRQPNGTTYITTLLGYVATTYGNKTVANVTAEIAKYNSWYKVDGIFFDEVSTNCSLTRQYSSLVQYVQTTTQSPTKQDFTILNWGTNGPECFLNASSTNPIPADNFVTFEGPYSQYGAYSPASYTTKYSPSRFYNIIYNVSQANLNATVTKSKNNRAGLVYVTNDTGTNPYDEAPRPYRTYWQVEVSDVAKYC